MTTRRMSVRMFVAALVAAASIFLPATAEAELSKRDVKSLVGEYVKPETRPERRAAIFQKLRMESRPALAQDYLKSALKDDDERPYALDLATQLKVEGLFKTLKKDIDGDDEDRIVNYLFATQDDGAMSFMFDRWKEKEVSDASFTLVKEGFAKHYVDLDTIGKFRDYLKNKEAVEDKKSIARLILLVQMDLPTSSQVDIEDAWKDFYVEHKTNSLGFSMLGRDVMRMTGWGYSGRLRKFGNNFKLFKNAGMEFAAIPDDWQKADFSLKIGVRVTEGSGCTVAFVTDAGQFSPEVEDGKWVVKVGGGGSKSCPFKLGEWVTIEFDCTYRDQDAVDYRRNCVIRVGSEVVLDNGLLSGKMERLVIVAGENAVLTVGGIEYREKKS